MYEMSRYEIAPQRQRVVCRRRCVPLARSTRSRIFPFFLLSVSRYAVAVTTSCPAPRSAKEMPGIRVAEATVPDAGTAAATSTAAAAARRRLRGLLGVHRARAGTVQRRGLRAGRLRARVGARTWDQDHRDARR